MAGIRAASIAAVVALGIGASPAAAGVVETGPDRLADTLSLGSIIASSAGAPVHILFVHGMRAGDRGASDIFRTGLCKRLKGICDATQPPKTELNHRLAIGPPPDLAWMGQPIWSDAAWSGGAPFVDRYTYARLGGGAPIVVDEINWWPLALPLRCLALLQPEAELAGPDVAGLRTCAAVDGKGNPLNDGIHYPFLAKADLDRLIATRPKGGGAAAANGFVKRALMDWGLSDAVIALGPMKDYLHETIDQAFAYAAEAGPRGAGPAKYVVVAESLGAFIVFDAYAHHKRAVQAVLDDTAYLYFFANQLALLELGRLGGSAARAGLSSATPPLEPSPLAALQAWGAHRALAVAGALPADKQIIAFSDPSDALTFRVPPIGGVKVVNLYDRNGVDILHIAADPVAAHTGHGGNPQVLDVMLARPR